MEAQQEPRFDAAERNEIVDNYVARVETMKLDVSKLLRSYFGSGSVSMGEQETILRFFHDEYPEEYAQMTKALGPAGKVWRYVVSDKAVDTESVASLTDILQKNLVRGMQDTLQSDLASSILEVVKASAEANGGEESNGS